MFTVLAFSTAQKARACVHFELASTVVVVLGFFLCADHHTEQASQVGLVDGTKYTVEHGATFAVVTSSDPSSVVARS